MDTIRELAEGLDGLFILAFILFALVKGFNILGTGLVVFTKIDGTDPDSMRGHELLIRNATMHRCVQMVIATVLILGCIAALLVLHYLH